MVQHPVRYGGAASIIFFLILQGCAPAQKNLGHDLIERGEYAKAVRPLKMAIAQDYTDIESIRDMGIAMYHAHKLKLAKGFLHLALSRSPRDLAAIYYLGTVHEDAGQIDQAIQQYTRYAEISRGGSSRRAVEARIQVLVRQQMAEQIKTLLAQEAALDAAAAPENSIAVLYFTNLSNNPDYVPLQKGLADMIITDLAQVRSLQVVERARMQLLMDEMGLGMSGLVKEETAPRMGKLLSASRIVQGTFSGAEQNNLRIDAVLATLGTINPVPANQISGPLEEFYQLEKDVVFNLIDVMGLRLSRQEREAIQRIPTKNLMAFMAYCRGLDDEDQGKWQSAESEFKAAVSADPGFDAAAKGVERSAAFSSFAPKPAMVAPSLLAAAGSRNEPKVESVRRSASAAEEPAASGAVPEINLGTIDILTRTAAQVTPGFFPGPESRKPTTEAGSTPFGAGIPIDVRIHLPVKQ